MKLELHELHLVLVLALMTCPAAVSTCDAQYPQRVAFVTSWSGSGDLSTWMPAGVAATGLDAADWVCRYLAQEAELDHPEDFVAWMSDSSNDAYCRVHGFPGTKADNCGLTELPSNAGPWVRPCRRASRRMTHPLLSP